MSLLFKALQFREDVHSAQSQGLLNRSLAFSKNVDASYPSAEEIQHEQLDLSLEPLELKTDTDSLQIDPVISDDLSFDETETVDLDSLDAELVENREAVIESGSQITDNDEITLETIALEDMDMDSQNIEEDLLELEPLEMEELESQPVDTEKSGLDSLDVQENVLTGDVNDDVEGVGLQNKEREHYYALVNQISVSLSTLLLNMQAYHKFTEIIASSFNFSKCALLIFSPPAQKFIFWDGLNIDEESRSLLKFDLNFNNVYKRLTKDKSFSNKPGEEGFDRLKSMVSTSDFNEVEFQMWIPFVFSARIIGIFLGLAHSGKNGISDELQNAMEIIGRLNGPLLYNILQKQQLELKQKKNPEITDTSQEPESISDSLTPIPEYINTKLHKMIVFTHERIKKKPELPLSVIHVQIPALSLSVLSGSEHTDTSILNDIQFTAMNVVGTNGFVQVFRQDDNECVHLYIMLNEVEKFIAVETAKEVKKELTGLFIEVFGLSGLSIEVSTRNHPDDLVDYIGLFE